MLCADDRDQCCNSCDEVIDAFKKKGWGLTGMDRWKQCVAEGYTTIHNETCRLDGLIRVSQVSGEFHMAMVEGVRLGSKKKVDISRIPKVANFSHTIHYLEFGPKIPDVVQPLDDTTILQEETGKIAYIYHLDVVPTRWISRRGYEVHTFKYSPSLIRRNLSSKQATSAPGLYFHYRIAPYSVVSKETVYTFWEFVTSVSAIVGGAFACASLAEKFLFRALSTIEGKRQIGKLT